MEIMEEPATSLRYKSTQSATTRRRRSRLLQTCAMTLLTIAQKAFRKGEELRWPIGATARKLETVAGPFFYVIQCEWLAILSFADDLISTIENVAESNFPPSGVLFDKIESLVYAIESLPRKIDHVCDELETTTRKAAELNSPLNKVITVLDHLMCTLIDPKCRRAKEKDIIEDEWCRVTTNDKTLGETRIEAQPERMKSEIHIKQVGNDSMEVSGNEGKNKEKEKRGKKSAKKREVDIVDANKEEEEEEEETENVEKKELIMELFDAGWGI